MQKILDIGEDPFIYINKGAKTSGYSSQWRDLPQVTYRDIIFYLVETHSFYTQQQIRAYKGTDAYRFVYSGWVTSVRSKKCSDSKIVVTAKVRHSQQPTKTPCYTWVCTTVDGIVLYGHCTCKAGLGEVCSHTAALLFYIDETVYYNTNQECCTSRPCQWIVPKQFDQLDFKMVKDIDFSNPKSRHSQLKERDVNPAARKEVKQPTEEEQAHFLRSIAACNQTSTTTCKPAILSLLDEFADDYLPKTDSYPENLLDLRQVDKLQASLKNLQDEALDVMARLQVSPTQAGNLQMNTQHNSKLWYTYRAGRVTASNMHAATHTSVEKPSKSLIKRICYPHTLQFSSHATEWGKHKEKEVQIMYKEYLKEEHINVAVSDCGLFIHPDFPHLGATPDGIVECKCCGMGICEIKCPYTCRNNSITSGTVKCLKKAESGDLHIDKHHPYYYQIQSQVFLTEANYCDFVVWTTKDLHIERIYPDASFWNALVMKATSFFTKVLLPELVGAYWTRSAHPEE